MNTIVPDQGAVSPVCVDGPRQATGTERPTSTCGPDSAAAWAAALEHEARGMLNLIAIASRCLERSANPGEREAWRREIEAAREQLERLCRAGLSRGFLEDRAGHRGVGSVQPGAFTPTASSGDGDR